MSCAKKQSGRQSVRQAWLQALSAPHQIVTSQGRTKFVAQEKICDAARPKGLRMTSRAVLAVGV